MRCGLLGEKLGHSYSKAIHERLGGYSYELIECPRAELDAFMKGDSFDAINVTIPYKKAVIPYCAALSPIAERIGSVNAVIRQRDGSLYGDNTDAYGFMSMVKKSGVDIAGRKAIVLGSGGASATICAVLNELNAKSVAVISRSGQDNYENIQKHADAEIIVNTTPVGMYPNTGVSPVDLSVFKSCKGVLDIVYNPHRTALLMQAEALGIPCMGGLNMLVAQAKRAAELFTGTSIPDSRTDEIERELSLNMQNIVLIGMPGCGKSTIAAALGKRLNRAVRDSDEATEAQAGMHEHTPDIRPARGGCVPQKRNRGPFKARQAERAYNLHRRRLRYAAGKLSSAAPERHYNMAHAQHRRAAHRRAANIPKERHACALRRKKAAVRAFLRHYYRQQRFC